MLMVFTSERMLLAAAPPRWKTGATFGIDAVIQARVPRPSSATDDLTR